LLCGGEDEGIYVARWDRLTEKTEKNCAYQPDEEQAKEEADPCGMTNKRAKQKGKTKGRGWTIKFC
jgi:hypothetical protein